MLRHQIEDMPFDPELSPGAANAIHTCLNLQPEERITLVLGKECLEEGAALLHEVKKTGAEYAVFVLEDYCPRPCVDIPHDILHDLKQSQVSIYAAHAKTNELHARTEITRSVNAHRIRHGHMVNLSKKIMMQGMRANFWEVDALSTRVIDQARQTHVIRAKTPAGTDIEAHFSSTLHWIKTSGLITSTKWGNLPGGEIFTSPFRVDGIFVVDGVVGDYLCDKYGDLKASPLYIEIEDSRIRKLACDNQALLADFEAYVAIDENADRVGEFAIGTNLAVTEIIGNILQDEKIPGIHLAFGDPYWEHTGQKWQSKGHIDCVGRDFDIWMDGDQIMKSGKFTLQ